MQVGTCWAPGAGVQEACEAGPREVDPVCASRWVRPRTPPLLRHRRGSTRSTQPRALPHGAGAPLGSARRSSSDTPPRCRPCIQSPRRDAALQRGRCPLPGRGLQGALRRRALGVHRLRLVCHMKQMLPNQTPQCNPSCLSPRSRLLSGDGSAVGGQQRGERYHTWSPRSHVPWRWPALGLALRESQVVLKTGHLCYIRH